ncbi:ABC transporter substrate-binding protein [Piscinibacter sp. HJYY11]|uniref:ABC transporter substrate-binding protein n=1 Tax=Piscinibacter sp. HJYY11 TaxID=2801333 RepID=UPI00191E4040|nr:ABC transporter substrate-binding protein [Piscinibacter sp. HJYY11]MBL0728999.1 bicyclomycin resistance protein [Piscinibacter sp. HJYY11]
MTRGLGAALMALLMVGAPAVWAQDANAPKVLRYSFRVAETGFDPAQISDLYSRTIAANIFDAPLQYEFLARPFRYRPNTVASMPEVSADFKTFTFRLKPGIYFADDPAFKGKKRELVAADYVYAWKRHADPRWKSPNFYLLDNAKIVGLTELRNEVLKDKKPFDYEREVEGLKVIDKYTFQVKTAEPRPRLLLEFTDGSAWGAVAREVVEAYGDKIMEHPVGTGPYKLASWRRASKIVLEKNPAYREEFYDEEAPADDPIAQAAVAKLKGNRLPMIDRIEIAIVAESQPRWLAFLNREHDILWEVPSEFSELAMPRDQLAPNLKKRDITLVRYPRADVALSYFNMEDPVVGGYTPDKVALRRAISLATDVEKEIRVVRKKQAVPSQGPIAPSTWGHNPALKTEMSDYDPARAKALLDLYGYVDRDGDGWRDQPDGKPLVLEYATQPDQASRQLAELWQKNMEAIRVRIAFKVANWPDNLKASTGGKLMMWGVGWSAGAPDGETFLALGDGNSKGQSNKSRFDLPAYNRAFQHQKGLPNGPERQAAMDEAQRLIVAYAPYKFHVHRIFSDLSHPWVIGYHRNNFVREFWKWIDIDVARQQKEAQR